ncbi:MAG: hypothetical protein H7A33_02780 [Deltaproteobacteria bacterium]|nr:hypothetical protein [Deltaproteobacteria bacterium]
MTGFSKEDFFADLDTMIGRGVKPGLERMRAATSQLKLHFPQQRLIHLAGTNGKGSTTLFLSQMLASHGKSVGLTLSPHVDDFRERIQFLSPSGSLQFIAWEDLIEIHLELKQALDLECTYYEWVILLAMRYFCKQDFDFVVLETGLGGRLDATNVWDAGLAAITTVGLDHMAYLGDTHAKILSEKLCIAKPGSRLLFAPQDQNLVEQAQEYCAQNQVSFKALAAGQDASYLDHNFRLARELCQMILGEEFNASLVSPKRSDHNWVLPPARFEKISTDPLVIRDGAHNEQGLKSLRQKMLSEWGENYDLVFSCLSDRDPLSLVPLIQGKGRCFWVEFDAEGRGTARAVWDKVQRQYGGKVLELNEELLMTLQEQKSKPILVCGSLYFCGAFLSLWQR